MYIFELYGVSSSQKVRGSVTHFQKMRGRPLQPISSARRRRLCRVNLETVRDGTWATSVSSANRKSHNGFRSVLKSVTLNDLDSFLMSVIMR